MSNKSPLKKCLHKDPALHKKYGDFMEDPIKKGYARKVSKENLDNPTVWYLPHHAVFHPQKPDKVRVVFDCSAKFQGTSLNDQLLQGPDLTNTLVCVLTRFRQEQTAFMSDIEAMFYQVQVSLSDRDYLQFLWWPDGDLDKDPEEHQTLVHLFGGASSLSCANFPLKKTAEDNKAAFDAITVDTVKRNFYVDDVQKDTFGYKIAEKERPMTRRGILSIICLVSDPLGFVSPCILPAKAIQQDLCLKGLGWDDQIPEPCKQKWQSWLNKRSTWRSTALPSGLTAHAFFAT